MIFEEEFKFLNIQKLNKRETEGLSDDEKYFLIISVLDKENFPCKFYSFDKDLNKSLLLNSQNGVIKGLQDCLIKFSLNFNNNNWSVKLEDILFDY